MPRFSTPIFNHVLQIRDRLLHSRTHAESRIVEEELESRRVPFVADDPIVHLLGAIKLSDEFKHGLQPMLSEYWTYRKVENDEHIGAARAHLRVVDTAVRIVDAILEEGMSAGDGEAEAENDVVDMETMLRRLGFQHEEDDD